MSMADVIRKEMAMAEQNFRKTVASSEEDAPVNASAFYRAIRYFRRHGMGKTIKRIIITLLRLRGVQRYYASGRLFDEKNSVQTSGKTLLAELTIDEFSSDQSMWYEPAPINVVPNVLRNLRESYENFTFVDLGSGRGRAVLQASHFDFKKIVGVEFAKELHRHAVENLRRYQNNKQRCQDVELLCVDVRDYEFPDTDMVVFIFDSFKVDLLRHVVGMLKASFYIRPRKIYLVYLNPDRRNQPIPTIEGSGFLHKKEIFSFFDEAKYSWGSPYDVVVYETR